ncbi:MAG: choice-of-anchor D domain-containing protein [Candidatus Bipolaricaulaceae bacterium]
MWGTKRIDWRTLPAALGVALLLAFAVGGAAQDRNLIFIDEPVELGCGQIREMELSFEGPEQVLTHTVYVEPGATLLVYVQDLYMEGDVWQACITGYGAAERRNLLITPEPGNCTRSDGSQRWSPPAEFTPPDGRAYVAVEYVRGVDVWPAHMNVRLECVCEEPGAGKETAVVQVIGQILHGQTYNKAVYVYPRPLNPGERVSGWGGEALRTPTEQEWYVFVDDHVNANFEHDCRHVFVSAATGAVNAVVPATTPPRNLFADMELAERGPVAGLTAPQAQVPAVTSWASYSQGSSPPQPPSPPSPPNVPGAPESQEPPPGEQNLLSPAPPVPQPAGLYVYYMGGYTTVGQTTLGGHLPVYANMPSSGILWLGEYYQSSAKWRWYFWPASAGWKKLWFTGDESGWHSIIAYTTGGWTNWIHIYVGPGGPTVSCSVSPTSLSFGSVQVGFSASKTFVIKNTGGGFLSGTVSESCSHFSVSPGSFSLAPGASKTFTVTFAPSSTGNKACTIQISSPCSNVSCTGYGGPPPVTAKKYAILLSGGVDSANNWPRYLKDLTKMYWMLRNKYGYADANIYVLYADGSGPGWVDHSATKANLLAVFNTLQSAMTGSDELLVFVTNHGGQIVNGTNQVRIWLWNYEWIADWEFAGKVNALPGQAEKYFLFEQCFSGGMIDNLAGSNRVIATACGWNEPSYACDGVDDYGYAALEYDEFSLHWTQRLETAAVTLKQAFDYAKSKDTRSESPQYSDPSGIGFTTGL